MNPAFVYLAQNTPADPQWGRDSRTLLVRSLDKLYENYNARFKQRVIVFHEGDFSPQDQRDIAGGRDEIRFEEVRFEIPDFLDPDEIPEVWTPPFGPAMGAWGLGHRHMCRFYAVQVFDILQELGHDWICRFDDDSVLHSRVDYDLFAFMEKHGYEYGYRVRALAPPWLADGFGDMLKTYIEAHGIQPSFLFEHFIELTVSDRFRNLFHRALALLRPWHRYLVKRQGDYDRWGYFNNFYISRVAFWKSEPVQKFLRHLDKLGVYYKWRWDDLIIQSAAVQIFMPKTKVYRFADWTYEHATIREGDHLEFGGIWQGDQDENSPAVADFVARYGKAVAVPEWTC